ncbi:Dihydrofolate reductase type 3 [Enhygromyxa salina]|uniref:Dihydrofolate reductase n=1 Tax=Enhygromyxa salina TaxID=215803 RepID=A0A2S9YB48_9BACT|nr:dihydrofolate reductase [Enhygromyxa salina]PRQ02282.1 Dihydrofolate reductase type 3 [Enhygromyxa salina]
MRIALIAAASENDVIGRDNDLPWHLPDDFRHFKRTTRGHHVIMGRRTWESQGSKPLARRVNIVVTSRPDYEAPGALVAASLDQAFALAEAAGEDEAFVIGGTRMYAEALARADRLYLTRVHAQVEGDARFPSFDAAQWRELDRVEHPADDRHAHAFTILTLARA